jgi:copper homeostasis protein
MLYEVCVDSVEGALAAQNAGAQRIELCDNLVEGGTTPSLGMLQLAREKVSIGVNVLIRPRGGDFCCSELEFEIMRRDIQAAKAAGADGVVLGLLLPDGSIDLERTRRLLEIARPLPVTFHRAFDLCRAPDDALECLAALGVARILTSGQKKSALEGADCIARLVARAGKRLIILAGGGINAGNLSALVAATGIQECHFSARRSLESPMIFRNPDCFMGKAYQPDEYSRRVVDEALIRRVIQSLD